MKFISFTCKKKNHSGTDELINASLSCVLYPSQPQVPHRTLTFAAWNVLAARRVKSTGRAGFSTENVTTTGLYVPGVSSQNLNHQKYFSNKVSEKDN
ncbi:MAG: hypothetical protein ABIO36_10925 [Pyrinomonadaceae bacterium]